MKYLDAVIFFLSDHLPGFIVGFLIAGFFASQAIQDFAHDFESKFECVKRVN